MLHVASFRRHMFVDSFAFVLLKRVDGHYSLLLQVTTPVEALV